MMNIEEIREYCLSKPKATESCPFGEDILVFKVMGKMFSFVTLYRRDDRGLMLSLKCNPDLAIDLREKYNYIVPAYHMNKRFWNTIFFEENVDVKVVKEGIDHSFEEVLKKLPKKDILSFHNDKK